LLVFLPTYHRAKGNLIETNMDETVFELKAGILRVFDQPTRLEILECLGRAREISFESLISPTWRVWVSSYGKGVRAEAMV
jgi:hypothetical protein